MVSDEDIPVTMTMRRPLRPRDEERYTALASFASSVMSGRQGAAFVSLGGKDASGMLRSGMSSMSMPIGGGRTNPSGLARGLIGVFLGRSYFAPMIVDDMEGKVGVRGGVRSVMSIWRSGSIRQALISRQVRD